MNNANFFGRVDSGPRLLGMPGRDVCEFWLEVAGRRDPHTLHVLVVSFKGLAVRLHDEVREGDMIAISGPLRSELLPGSARLYRHSLIARDVRVLPRGSRSG